MSNPVIENLQRIRRELERLKKITITIGVQEEAGVNIHGANVSASGHMMMIAHVHEYGCTIKVTPKMRAFLHYAGLHLQETTEHVNIPERSFIRAARATGQNQMKAVAAQAMANMVKGKIDAPGVAHALGKAAVELTVGLLGADAKPIGDFAAEQRKGSSTGAPLHDTGALLNHITYSVEGRK
jgi:phage gpG-like protein